METALRAYEVMVILDPDLEERTVAPSLDTYLNVVRNDGGSVENVDIWGPRRLAYEINKKEEGFYVFFNVVAPAGSLGELERHLRLADEVVRHKLIRLPETEAERRGITGAAA